MTQYKTYERDAMSNITIRSANIIDALPITNVHIKSWQETYSNIFSSYFLNHLNSETRKTGWQETLADEEKQVYVAEVENQIVGFCSIEVREYHEENCAFLATLYLLQQYQKQRIGEQLFLVAKNNVRRLGYQNMYVEVLAENNALSFYRKYGGEIVDSCDINSAHQEKIKAYILKFSIFE